MRTSTSRGRRGDRVLERVDRVAKGRVSLGQIHEDRDHTTHGRPSVFGQPPVVVGEQVSSARTPSHAAAEVGPGRLQRSLPASPSESASVMSASALLKSSTAPCSSDPHVVGQLRSGALRGRRPRTGSCRACSCSCSLDVSARSMSPSASDAVDPERLEVRAHVRCVVADAVITVVAARAEEEHADGERGREDHAELHGAILGRSTIRRGRRS